MTKPPASGSLNGSPADVRHVEILDELARRHPESNQLLLEHSDLNGTLLDDAISEGVRRQAQLLRAVLGGDVWIDEGGNPQGQVPGHPAQMGRVPPPPSSAMYPLPPEVMTTVPPVPAVVSTERSTEPSVPTMSTTEPLVASKE